MKFTRKIPVISRKAYPNKKNANADNLDWIHCVGWRLRHDLEDPWTAFVMNAKAREPSDVQNAAACMAIYVKSLRLKHKHIYVVPIISSGDEQACEDDPSTVFSRTVAEAVGGICVVDALEKQPYSSLHSGRKSAAERDRLVAGAYTCTGFDFPADCTEPLILIVDDIVTRGSTMNDAARAIRAKHGDLQIGGLALAKWQWQEDAGNGYISEEILSAANLSDASVNAQLSESAARDWGYSEESKEYSADDLDQKRLRNTQNDLPANHGMPWSDEDIKSLIHQYKSNVPVKKIAAQFERTENSIIRCLKNHGVFNDACVAHKDDFNSSSEEKIIKQRTSVPARAKRASSSSVSLPADTAMSEDVSKGSVPEQSSPQIEGVVYLIAALTILITVSIIIGALNNQSLIDKQQELDEIVNRDPLPPIEKPLPAPPPIPPPYLPPAPRKQTNFERGQEARKTRDFATAEKYYTLYINEQPTHYKSYLWRGFCFFSLYKYEYAKRDFTVLIKANVELYFARKFRGILWYAMSKDRNADYDPRETLKNAKLDLQEALKLASNSSISGKELGHTNYCLYLTYTKLANMQVKYSDDHQYYRGEADHYFQESRKHGYKENR